MDYIEVGVGFAEDQDVLLSTTVSEQALETTQPPIQQLSGALYPTVKLPEQVLAHSHTYGPELKNMQSHIPFLRVFTAWYTVRQKDCAVVKCSLNEIVNFIITLNSL